MTNIFTSYNRRSENITKALINDIKALGYSLWFDQELSGGQTWWNQILAKIRECDLFIFVMEPEALNSVACKREYEYAAALKKTILPILVSDEVSTNLLPPALSQIQFVDYRVQDRDTAFRLARALNSIPPVEPLPDPLPDPPDVPISYLGDLTEKVDTLSILSYDEQSVLVTDLRRSLHSPDTAKDGRTLLARLRKRRDLFAAIAEEIDELLDGMKQTSSIENKPIKKDIPLPSPPKPKVKYLHWGAALWGALIGITISTIAMFFIDRSDLIVSTVTYGIAGAIAGLINGKDKRGFISIFVGIIIGFIFWLSLENSPTNKTLYFFMYVRSAVFGGAIGAILGAIIWRIKLKFKNAKKN